MQDKDGFQFLLEITGPQKVIERGEEQRKKMGGIEAYTSTNKLRITNHPMTLPFLHSKLQTTNKFVLQEDEAKYKCVVKNSEGQNQQSLNLCFE